MQKFEVARLVQSTRAKGAALVPMLFAAGTALAQTADTPETSIPAAATKVLALLALAGAAYVGIALAGVGWSVGVKFIKRMRGAA